MSIPRLLYCLRFLQSIGAGLPLPSMKYFSVTVGADLPAPHEFTYRVTAANAGRAADFAYRLLRKEPRVKGKRDTTINFRVISTTVLGMAPRRIRGRREEPLPTDEPEEEIKLCQHGEEAALCVDCVAHEESVRTLQTVR